MLKTLDPKKHTIIFGGKPIAGFADGTYIQIEYESDHWEDHVGADGEVTRVRSADDRATITLTLTQSSASNDHLSTVSIADRTGNTPQALLMKDELGTSLYAAARAWVRKQAPASFAKSVENREWVLRTDSLVAFTGGNTVTGPA